MKDHVKITLLKPFQTLQPGEVVEFPIGSAELLIERKVAEVYREDEEKKHANTRQRNNH